MTIDQAMTRRAFNRTTMAVVLGGALPLACSDSDGESTYDGLVAKTWRHSHGSIDSGPTLLRELVRYATLAPNSHNTQPWRFRIEPNRLTVLPDFSRRCPAVDPDDHHLFVSLGCASENLTLAAEAHGLRASVLMAGTTEGGIQIDFEPVSPSDSPLFRAIPQR